VLCIVLPRVRFVNFVLHKPLQVEAWANFQPREKFPAFLFPAQKRRDF